MLCFVMNALEFEKKVTTRISICLSICCRQNKVGCRLREFIDNVQDAVEAQVKSSTNNRKDNQLYHLPSRYEDPLLGKWQNHRRRISLSQQCQMSIFLRQFIVRKIILTWSSFNIFPLITLFLYINNSSREMSSCEGSVSLIMNLLMV